MAVGLRSAKTILVIILLGWLGYRIYWITNLPAVFATDPYIRLFHRDELVIEFLGRKWLPLLQLAIRWIYDRGGAVDEVQIFTAVAGTALVLIAVVYLFRAAGAISALLFLLLLSVNEDIVWISASPFQEVLFYILAIAVLLVLQSANERRGPWWPVILGAPFLALSLLCRYEGLLLGAAAATAIAWGWWNDRSIRSPIAYATLAIFYVVLPAAGLAWFNSGSDAIEQAYLTNLFATAQGIGLFLGTPYIFVWLSLVAVRFALVPTSPTRWPLDGIATGLFLIGFVAVYMLWNPFAPPQNSRFHIPLVLAILAAGSASVPLLFEQLTRSLSPPRVRVLTAVFALLFAAHVGRQWSDTTDIMVDRGKNKIVDATIGRAADFRVPPPKDLLLLWDRAAINGHPSGTNMQVSAFLRGKSSRIRFLDDYDELPLQARTDWIRESAGGYLIEAKRSPAQAVKDLLQRTASVHGDEILAVALPRGTTLITWGEPPSDDEASTHPAKRVRIGDLRL